MTDLTVETIKLVHPHYTDAQAEAHLAMHMALEPARALIASRPNAAPLMTAFGDVVRLYVKVAAAR